MGKKVKQLDMDPTRVVGNQVFFAKQPNNISQPSIAMAKKQVQKKQKKQQKPRKKLEVTASDPSELSEEDEVVEQVKPSKASKKKFMTSSASSRSSKYSESSESESDESEEEEASKPRKSKKKQVVEEPKNTLCDCGKEVLSRNLKSHCRTDLHCDKMKELSEKRKSKKNLRQIMDRFDSVEIMLELIDKSVSALVHKQLHQIEAPLLMDDTLPIQENQEVGP
jgi:hypothetical protein